MSQILKNLNVYLLKKAEKSHFDYSFYIIHYIS